MSDEFPLFPELSEAAKQEAQALMGDFKRQLKKLADEVLGNLYCDVIDHIETDSWTNYRNDLMDGFQNYNNRLVQGEHDFKKIRQAILKEHREDIIADLNQDLVAENEQLKKQLEQEREWRRKGY